MSRDTPLPVFCSHLVLCKTNPRLVNTLQTHWFPFWDYRFELKPYYRVLCLSMLRQLLAKLFFIARQHHEYTLLQIFFPYKAVT